LKVIITGAASGIGLSVAEKLATGTPGAKLLLVDRNGAQLAAITETFKQRGTEVEAVTADLTQPRASIEIVERMESRFGGIDAIVSNAGGVRGAPLAELTTEDFDYAFALNTRPTWLLAKAAYPMLRASRGAIVATASTAGEYPTPPLGTYSASKAALIMLVRQMAVEWGSEGIRCNTVSPGPTVTGITQSVYSDPERVRQRTAHIPLGRLGMPEDLAETILFLIDKRSSHISGINITVDGGQTAAMMRGTGSGSGKLRNE
jgi:NAD(P)-dependent dehydrogenase (short-subunit alcohol dehydrogenase family)